VEDGADFHKTLWRGSHVWDWRENGNCPRIRQSLPGKGPKMLGKVLKIKSQVEASVS
jgi:hypothetical protein